MSVLPRGGRRVILSLMERFRRARHRVELPLAMLLALVAGSCATSGQTVSEEAGGTVAAVGSLPDGEASPTDAETESGPEPTPVSTEYIDSLVAVIRTEAAEPRPRSVLPFGVTWTPASPVEGSAIAFQVLQPLGGLEPQAVVGKFADGVVRFARAGKAWLGFAAVPIDVHGTRSLDLEFRFGDGQVHRQAVQLTVASRDWDETSLSVAPRYSSPPAEVLERIARDREAFRAVLDRSSPEWILSGPFETPRPFVVTSEYGQKRLFNGELQSRHTGLDLRGQVGTPVHAAGRGRVVLTGDFYYSGNGIFLDHGLGVYTGYFHLSEILVSEGDLVEPGDLIGKTGATGRVTGPHLHWSLWVDGKGQDAGSLLQMDIPRIPTE